jgi:hypothetical protein
MKFFPVLQLSIWLCCILSSCLHTQVSRKTSAGENLSFEIAEKGRPVNWIIYEPPYCDYRATLDSIQPKEGMVALRFDMGTCSREDRIDYTGFTNEFMERTRGGGRFRISFWMKNKGTHFRIYLNETGAKESGNEPIIIESSDTINEWKQYQAEVNVQPEKWLRFELQVNGEGSCWVDDVTIERIEGR